MQHLIPMCLATGYLTPCLGNFQVGIYLVPEAGKSQLLPHPVADLEGIW